MTKVGRPPAATSTPSPSVRGAVDALVQGSLVDLFAAYGVAVAPLPRHSAGRAPPVPEISSSVAFVNKEAGQSGRLTLSLPSAVLDLTRVGDGLRSDWARELANQLMGRVKNRLLQFSVRLEAGVASTIEPQQLASHLAKAPAGVRMYSGRTLRGEVLVTLHGVPEDSKMVYRGPVDVFSEGDIIIF